MGPRAGLDRCGKSRPHRDIRSPDRPARSQSLYRLSYLDRCDIYCYDINFAFVLIMENLNNSFPLFQYFKLCSLYEHFIEMSNYMILIIDSP